MTASDRQGFAELMLGIGEAYGEVVTEARMEIYFAALKDLPLLALRQAATVHIQTQRFFPRVAEIREAVHGPVEDRAELAWVALLQQVRRVGYMGTPQFPDLVAQRAAMELYGSWRALCERLPSEGPEFLGAANRYRATYAAYARREVREGLALPLSKDEARAVLGSLGRELGARGLPAPGLPR